MEVEWAGRSGCWFACLLEKVVGLLKGGVGVWEMMICDFVADCKEELSLSFVCVCEV